MVFLEEQVCFTILANNRENEDVLVNKAATFYSFSKGTSNQRYPTSLMGSIALIKQTLLDSEWHERTSENSNISLSEYNANKNLAKIFEVKSHLIMVDYLKSLTNLKLTILLREQEMNF